MKKPQYFIYTKIIGLYINLLSFIFPKSAIKIACGLFGEPRKGRLSIEKLPDFLQQSEIENFAYKGQKFKSYIWKGNETVILLAHGWESNGLRWQKFLSHLQETGSTIIAVDGPAHGLSSGTTFDIPKYAAFINVVSQKYNPQYLIGHSLGGKTCLFYQYFYKNNAIKKIVTLGSPSDFKIILKNYVNLLSLNSRVVRGVELQYRKIFRSSLSFFSASYFASKLECKGLIVHDTFDTTVNIEEGKKIVSTWKDSEFIETQGLGHSLHDDELYKKVVTFMFKS
jgi:pimeloyl-ACP methyl ester carboxylesterase